MESLPVKKSARISPFIAEILFIEPSTVVTLTDEFSFFRRPALSVMPRVSLPSLPFDLFEFEQLRSRVCRWIDVELFRIRWLQLRARHDII